MKKITLPVTPDGNDPADYDEDGLAQMEKEITKAKASDISKREAEEYVRLYEKLKVKKLQRSDEPINCPKTNARYELCLAVLGREK